MRRLALGAVLVAVAAAAVPAPAAAAAPSPAAAAVPALAAAAGPALAAAAGPAPAARSAGAWRDVAGRPAATRNGRRPQVRPRRLRALALDRAALAGVLAGAPRERAAPALEVSLPAPGGGFERFAVRRSSVMEAGLAARHPEIATYAGAGIDEPGATVHLDLTALGFHASVRGPGGSWYVDPYYHRDESLYASYRGADLADPDGAFRERRPPPRAAAAPSARGRATRAGEAVALRTYRLALASDPSYATYHGAANVTSAKATLVDRVNQVYEDDLAIHLTLVAGNDVLNLDTAAQMTGPNGPCGAAACYTAGQAASCDVGTLDRNRVVLGQLIGASNYDVGHIGLGTDHSGIAYLGVAGDDFKGGGCTGVETPVGDLFAVDYVAHELGHQFAGNHTFDGVDGNCGANGSNSAVEPGSGVTVMAYAGICATDDLQPHSDPYFSQRSIAEIGSYAGSSPGAVDEVQTVSLRDFSGSDSFRLTFGGAQSASIARGSNYSSSGIATAIRAIPGFPASASVTVRGWDGGGASPTDSGFSVRFGGALANTDAGALSVTSPVGTTGFAGETAQGGPSRNGGSVTTPGNHAPIVEAPAGFTIPTRTPFALTGSATDADGDTLTYLWEQNDAGSGTSLVSNSRTNGPLFRVFGTAAAVSDSDTLLSPSPGENAAGTDPTRTFPDLAQIAAGTTNATGGSCPAPGDPVTAAVLDCYSEFLPTAAYANTLHFRLTARDGHPGAGGVAHDDTTLTLAKGAGPFRVTSQAGAATVEAGAPLTVTWSVAGTNAAPVNVANVRITMSTDGGLTFDKLVTRSTPNDGSQVVFLPDADTTHARIRVDAIGNVFFDVNDADLTITPGAPVVTNDAPGGVATGQYSDPTTTAVAISATDENTAGSSLTAGAAGLPPGLTLAPGPDNGGAIPGSRLFAVAGTILAAPGTYPVEVSAGDGAGHTGLTFFDVVVTPEDAAATYTGDTLVTAAPGAAQAQATLRATVLDGAAAPMATDLLAGDVANATVTFREGATTLCAAVPVVTAGSTSSGTATCTAALAAGASHRVDAVVGGHYTGSAAGDVRVDAVAGPTPPAAPPPPPPAAAEPPPPAAVPPPPPPPAAVVPPAAPPAPAAAILTPDLTRVAARLRPSATGRVALRLRCRTLGTGPPPSRCTGTVRLAARIGGVTRTIASGRFSFLRATTATVRVRLTARGRAAVRTASRTATLTMSVPRPGGATRRATKRVTLLPARS